MFISRLHGGHDIFAPAMGRGTTDVAGIVTTTAVAASTSTTLTYLVLFGFFDRGTNVVLSLLMLLKLGFAGTLAFAHQRFVQNKGLILLVLTSLLANIILSFLHNLVPGFLVSITDAIAALIVSILAVIWLVLLLFGSLFSIVKAIRPTV